MPKRDLFEELKSGIEDAALYEQASTLLALTDMYSDMLKRLRNISN